MDKQFAEVNQKTDKQFAEVNQKIDNLQKESTETQKQLAGITEKLDAVDKRVIKLENNQTTQIWALIVVIIGTFLKFGFFANA